MVSTSGYSSDPTGILSSSDEDLAAILVMLKRTNFDRKTIVHLHNLMRQRTIEPRRQNQEPEAIQEQEQELLENPIPNGGVPVDGHQQQQQALAMSWVEEHQLPDNPVAKRGAVVEAGHHQYYQPLDMPQIPKLNGSIGQCSEPFEKKLMVNDVDPCLNRMRIGTKFGDKLMPMLNADEHIEDGIRVDVYDWGGRVYEMKFIRWNNRFYVLTRGWKDFVQLNGLRNYEHLVKLWMFRHLRTAKLCFAITWRRHV